MSRLALAKSSSQVEDSILEIQCLHNKETDVMLSIMKHRVEEQWKSEEVYKGYFEAEIDGLGRQLSALTSENTLLKVQSRAEDQDRNRPTAASSRDLTARITAISTRIKRWNDRAEEDKGQITISQADLDSLVSDLSDASSQITELQVGYTELSKDLSSDRGRMKAVQVEEDGIIAVELAQLKNADSVKTGQSATNRPGDEMAKSTTTSTTEIRQRRRGTPIVVEETGLPASKAISNQQRQQVQDSLQRKPSVHFESVPRTITSTSTSLETRRFSVPARSSGAIENSLFEIQHLHRQENDHMLLMFKARMEEHQKQEQMYIERVGVLEREREELVQKLNASTSSQLIKLQRDYGEVSEESIPVRRRLEMALSLCNEKDCTIESIKEECAGKGQQIIALRGDNDSLRRDVSALTAEMEERQNAAVTDQLATAREELKKRAKAIEDKDQFISSLQDDITRLERSEATKAREVATLRQQCDTVRDKSAEEIEMVQKRCATLTKESDSARNELYESQSLVENKDRTIASLKSEVTKLKGDIDSTAQQQDTALQEKEGLQKKLVTSVSKLSKIQEAFEVQSKETVSLRGKLQIKEILLSEQEHVITSITTERDQARREVAAKEELLASARQKAEQLRLKVIITGKEKTDLQGQFEAQLMELYNIRDEHDRLKVLLQSLRGGADGHQADAIHRALEEKEKEIQALRRDIAVATTRESDLQKSREELSIEISAVSDDLRTKTSLHENAKDTIDSLTVQVDKLRSLLTDKTEQLGETNSRVRELELEVNTFNVQLKGLQDRYDALAEGLISANSRLNSLASIEKKDHEISTLRSSDITKAEQLARIHQELSDCISQNPDIRNRQQRCELQPNVLYGVACSFPVDMDNDEHIQRKNQWEADPTGELYVPGYFQSKVRMGADPHEEKEFRDTFSLVESDPTDFGVQTISILCYRGSLSDPKWVDEDRSSFSVLCTIDIDLSEAVKDLVMEMADSGEVYYQLDYDVIVSFGPAGVRAEICWVSGTGQRRIPAKITYED